MTTNLQHILKTWVKQPLADNWDFTNFNIKSFSKNKNLYDYQQSAVENAIKALYLYYEQCVNYLQNEDDFSENNIRKQKLLDIYKKEGLFLDKKGNPQTIKLSSYGKETFNILSDYFSEGKSKYEISYHNIINQASFWMATGSGKTLVLVKIIEILKQLTELGEIPNNDILILTANDALITQIKKHIDEYNFASRYHINVHDLKDYHKTKRFHNTMLKEDINVFLYNSRNLITGDTKIKQLAHREYDNFGNWYIFLDEAHKGDKTDSKAQNIFSVMARKGFLFNFSATFTDQFQKNTTAFDFKLDTFINEGYGKQIYILEREIKLLGGKDDISDKQKNIIILKSLILIAYINKFYEKIKASSLAYHKPLMAVLTNTVYDEKSDLMKFYHRLSDIARNTIDAKLFDHAKEELKTELINTRFTIGDDIFELDKKVLASITVKAVRKYVFNCEVKGNVSLKEHKKNHKEVLFSLSNSKEPFLLIKVGSSREIKNNILERCGYIKSERHYDETTDWFSRLNDEKHPAHSVNILLGSRAFYEGWDSNRPNIMLYINIGKNAQKFVLQSVGRGIRIEPVKNFRKRFKFLAENKPDDIKEHDVVPIETLFLMSTYKKEMEGLLTNLKKQTSNEAEPLVTLSLFENDDVSDKLLLIPRYSEKTRKIYETTDEVKNKFELADENKLLLETYLGLDSRLIFLKNIFDRNIHMQSVLFLKEKLLQTDKNKSVLKVSSEKNYSNINTLFSNVLNYLSQKEQSLNHISPLCVDTIKHYKNIQVKISRYEALKKQIQEVKNQKNLSNEQLTEMIRKGKINFALAEKWKLKEKQLDDLIIEKVINHYYIPVLKSENEKINWIKNIINVPSELEFLDALTNYLQDKKIDADFWLFSKLKETEDKIYIPYITRNNVFGSFYPDFVFWFKKATNYKIVFVDPKSTEYTDANRKIDGFIKIFASDDNLRVFDYKEHKVKVSLFMFNNSPVSISERYAKYWIDSGEIHKIFEM